MSQWYKRSRLEGRLMGQISVNRNVSGIDGLCTIVTTSHEDNRGSFMEAYNSQDMREAGFEIDFVQDNQSMSIKGVLRGMHYQIKYPQMKLIRVVRGSIYDVAID